MRQTGPETWAADSVTRNPLVSVIIPAYQAEQFLGEALASVRAQTYQSLHVVVVDDGSTDATAEVIGRFPEVLYVRLASNGGPAVARNAGIAAARGEMVAFLDADDIMLPECIEVQVGHLLDNPECGCILAKQDVFAKPGVIAPAGLRGLLDPLKDPLVYSMSALVRVDALQRSGGFDPSFRVCSDMDWLFRLHARGVRIDSIDQVLVRRRIHGANISYRVDDLQRDLLRAVKSRITLSRRGDGTTTAPR